MCYIELGKKDSGNREHWEHRALHTLNTHCPREKVSTSMKKCSIYIQYDSHREVGGMDGVHNNFWNVLLGLGN